MIVIIGGGLTGLSCAYELSKQGIDTVVIEKQGFVGGLATTININECLVDLGPHFLQFVKEDDRMRPLLKELDLLKDLYHPNIQTGIYCGNRLFDFDPHSITEILSSVLSFVRMESLTFMDKIKLLGFFINFLRLCPTLDECFKHNKKYPDHLEKNTFKQWFIERAGERNYNVLMKPIMTAVFGSDADVPASWVAARLAKARPVFLAETIYEGSHYIKGGVGRISERLRDRIEGNGGEIRLNCEAKRILAVNNAVKEVTVTGEDGEEKIDAGHVVCTVPAPILLNLVQSLPANFTDILQQIKYCRIILCILGLDGQAGKFHCIHLSSDEIPFQRYTEPIQSYPHCAPPGKSFVCLEIYPTAQFSHLWEIGDDTIVQICTETLNRVLLGVKEKVEWSRVFRIPYGRVLPSLGKDMLVKNGLKTPVKGLFYASGEIFASMYETAYAADMSASVKKGYEVAKLILAENKTDRN